MPKFERNLGNKYIVRRSIDALMLETFSPRNQLTFHFPNVDMIINASQPSSTRTYTIPDVGTNGNFVVGTSNTINLTGNLIPSSDATYNIGSSTNRWNNLNLAGIGYMNSLAANNIYNTTLNTSGNVTIHASLYPGISEGGHNLGYINGTWLNVYASNLVNGSGSALAVPTTGSNLISDTATQTLTNKTIYFVTSGGTPTALNYYEEGSFTITLSGIWSSSQTGTVYFVKCGNMVILNFPSIYATSTSTNIIGVSGVPTRLQPARTQGFPIRVYVSGAISTTMGWADWNISGSYNIYATAAGGYFPSGSSNGLYECTVSYLCN